MRERVCCSCNEDFAHMLALEVVAVIILVCYSFNLLIDLFILYVYIPTFFFFFWG